MDGKIDGEDDGKDDGEDDSKDDGEDDDGDRFDDSHPGPSGLGSMSGDINAGFLGGPVGLCSSSFLSDVSVPRSLYPYSPSPSSVRSRSPVTSRGRGHSRGR